MPKAFAGQTPFQYLKISKEEQEKRGILGRLVGRIADPTKPTRNNRLYGKSLWEKVLADPIFNEKLLNRVLFGEFEHPENGRTSIEPKNITVCLAEKPKFGEDGFLYGVFDILNTECGKLLKTLLDYGSTFAISSRGDGDLFTNSRGLEEVDPDTYLCFAFDIVGVPGVQEARLLPVLESYSGKKKSLNEALTDLYNTANSENKKIIVETLGNLGISLAESLEPATPYMLRNDGKNFTCGKIHPYIKRIFEDDPIKSLKESITFELSNFSYLWFYDHTLYNETKEAICTVLNSITLCKELNIEKECIDKIVNFDYNSDYVTDNLDELIEIYLNLNDLTNLEFCRVRTSDMRFAGISGDTYFRISSINFNWFDIIWNFVESNKSFIESITICKDTQTFGGKIEFYKINNKEINLMPTDEFLELSGNPIIENVNFKSDINNYAWAELAKGKNINAIYEGLHPTYINGNLKHLKEMYLLHTFNNQIDESVNYDALAKEAKELLKDNYGNITNNKTLKIALKKAVENNKLSDIKILSKLLCKYDPEFVEQHSKIKEMAENGIKNNSIDDDNLDSNQIADSENTIEDAKLENLKNNIVYNINESKSWTDEECKKASKVLLKMGLMSYDDFVKAFNSGKFQCQQLKSTEHILNVENNKNDDGNSVAAIIDSLQEALKLKQDKESEVLTLNEKLSVCYAKEAKLEGIITKLKENLNSTTKLNELMELKLKSRTEKQTALIENANQTIRDLNKKCNEFVNKYNQLVEKYNSNKSDILSLNENLTTNNARIEKLVASNKSLKEDLAKTLNDLAENKKIYSTKLSESNNLVDKYKKVATRAINKYIDSQALKLDITSTEIKNRLPENYTFNDIDSICESLQQQKVSMNLLPFKTPNKLYESMNVEITGKTKREPILDNKIFVDDEIDESLKNLAGM